jgi:hypothetical protein
MRVAVAKTYEKQGEVFAHWPSDQDEQRDHSSGDLDGRSDCNSNRNFHLAGRRQR